MSDYNLNDNVNDDFPFEVSGIQYKMRYPLVEEIEKMQEMVAASELKKLKNEDTTEDDEELNAWLYAFITPVKEESPSIEDTMKKQNVKVLQNFTKMFKTEFGM